MRFRVAGGALHVHRCPAHPGRACDYFTDHALAWMLGNRPEATRQLRIYRRALVARISSLTATLGVVDDLLARLASLRAAA